MFLFCFLDAFAGRTVGGSVQPSGCGVGEMTAHIFADLLRISEGTQVKMFTRFLRRHRFSRTSPLICCTTRVVLPAGIFVDEGLGTFIINVNH